MDQSLKARLIGATVLVALAVLLIPELLTGRKADAPTVEAPAARDTRTFTIELGRSGGTMSNPTPAPAPAGLPSVVASPDLAPAGSDVAAVRSGDVATLTEDASAPPGHTPPASTAPAAMTPAPAAVQPVEQAPVAVPAAEPAAPGGSFLVQVGAFGSADAARKLVAELQAAGYAAQVAPITRNGRTLHRVRVGPASGRAAAREMAGRLEARGLPASVVESD
jgi:DedD protein